MLTKEQQSDFYHRLGKKIKNIRTQKKVSQEDLAKCLGFVSRISIVQIETGKQKVQLHTLLEMADFFKVTLEEVLPPLDTGTDLSRTFSKKLNKQIQREVSNPATINQIKSFILQSTTTKK